MIKERVTYNLACDQCGRLIDNTIWYDRKDVFGDLMAFCKWEEINGKHYCQVCSEMIKQTINKK